MALVRIDYLITPVMFSSLHETHVNDVNPRCNLAKVNGSIFLTAHTFGLEVEPSLLQHTLSFKNSLGEFDDIIKGILVVLKMSGYL